jgi:hypothetical protein
MASARAGRRAPVVPAWRGRTSGRNGLRNLSHPRRRTPSESVGAVNSEGALTGMSPSLVRVAASSMLRAARHRGSDHDQGGSNSLLTDLGRKVPDDSLSRAAPGDLPELAPTLLPVRAAPRPHADLAVPRPGGDETARLRMACIRRQHDGAAILAIAGGSWPATQVRLLDSRRAGSEQGSPSPSTRASARPLDAAASAPASLSRSRPCTQRRAGRSALRVARTPSVDRLHPITPS